MATLQVYGQEPRKNAEEGCIHRGRRGDKVSALGLV